MKKLFKNSFIALAVLALGFSACTEQVEYAPAEMPSNDQVYFSNTNATKIDIEKEAVSFDIHVSRIACGAAASVPVTVEADSLANVLFDFPATVEFGDSMTTAVYTVSVNEGIVLEYEQYSNISLSISEEIATPYGNSTFSFEVGVPAPWSDWEEFGKGTFNLGIYWSGTHSELPIYYREYLLNDIDAQFYIPGIANSMDLTIEYNRETGACQILPQYAATNANYGQVTITDIPHYPFTNIDPKDYETYPCTFDAEKGLFTFNVAYIVCTLYNANQNGSFGNGVETFQLDGYYVPDYSLTMEYRGNYVDKNGTNNAVISTTKGVDVAKYLMTVISADEDANAAIQGMLKGEVACDKLTEAGFYAYPMTASGNYKALAITFDAEDNPLEAYSTDFEFWVAGDSNPWESLGYAMYTDDVILPLYGNPAMSYYVEVLENKEQPGLFRLMDLCGPEYPFYTYGTYKEGSYIEIDATDPEAVWIEGWQSTGFDLGDGVIEMTSMAWYQANAQGATKEDAKEAGFCGTYADGVITFPADGILAAIGDKAYYGNRNGKFALDMTNLLDEIPAEAAASRSIAARMMMEIKAKTMGHVARFKKIDNSFLTPTDAVIE